MPKETIQQPHDPRKQKSIKWAIISGEINRQIDLILINNRFRKNCKNRANNHRLESKHDAWQTTQCEQMNVCLKLMRRYRGERLPGTGVKCNYNLQGMRTFPGEITQHFHKYDK